MPQSIWQGVYPHPPYAEIPFENGSVLGKGSKKRGESMIFYHTPLGPHPVWSFSRKKVFVFVLKNASFMAETNFTLGPISKTNKFPL